MMAVGVARPSAQGQAITSTETAATKPVPGSPCQSHQAAKVARAISTTTGTKTEEIRSTRRCTGALLAWASETRRMIRDSVDSAPTAVTCTRSRPSPLIEPPVTASPAPLWTGRDSPVISDSSSWLSPCSTTPSTGTRSPGRTITRSPGATRSAGISTMPSARSTRAVSGRSFERARMADAALRLARPSSHLPSITRVITMADASK